MTPSKEYVLGVWEASQVQPDFIFSYRPTKIAVVLSDVLNGVNPKVIQRADKCAVSLKRADPRKLRWILMVECGNGPKVVKLKGFRRGNSTSLSKMDLAMACSCKFTRWQGPEYHSKREDYLDGKPQGTASVPVIRDPLGINRVCKHVYATLQFVKNWTVER